MIEFLFLDLDDTILDFRKSEEVAITQTLQHFGVVPTQEVTTQYHQINDWHWKQLELGKITREALLENRFAVLFAQLGVPVDKTACARAYEKNLSAQVYFLPGAKEALAELQQKYRLFLVSNGTARVQASRMEKAGLYPYFEKVFISQELGANKPAKEFFDRSFAQIPGFDPSKAMIVGDSLSSDILGGNNAGIVTCWVNPTGKPHPSDIRVDYEIQSLAQLPKLLESL